MIAQRRLLSLLARRNFASSRFSSSQQIDFPQDKAGQEEKYQELCYKFEREWSKVQRETDDNQRHALDAELTPAQKQRINFIADAFISLSILEVRYMNHVIKERILKTTGLNPLKINIDWPSIKQLENGSWPPANPNWVMQQEAIARLWPVGQAGISQLFGSMMGGSGGSGASSEAPAEVAAVAAPVVEVPKEKLVYDIELSSFDPSSKIKIIKEVRTLFGLGLKEAKDLVEKTPCVLKSGCKKLEAEEFKEKLIALGCTIVLL